MVMDLLHIKDKKTKEVFKVRPTLQIAWIETRDGVRVRLHPTVIKTMVRKGQEFAGHTIVGTRDLILI